MTCGLTLEHLRLKIFIFNRGVAVTSPQSGTGAAKRGLPACSARASALAAAGRLPTIHWENAPGADLMKTPSVKSFFSAGKEQTLGEAIFTLKTKHSIKI